MYNVPLQVQSSKDGQALTIRLNKEKVDPPPHKTDEDCTMPPQHRADGLHARTCHHLALHLAWNRAGCRVDDIQDLLPIPIRVRTHTVSMYNIQTQFQSSKDGQEFKKTTRFNKQRVDSPPR